MQQMIDLGPVELRYAAALRGVAPAQPGASFRYIRVGAFDADEMLCLAASNPEGQFLFIGGDEATAMTAHGKAKDLRLANASFLGLDSGALRAALASGTQQIAPADYLCFDLTEAGDAARADAYLIAAQLAAPGGLVALRYAPFARAEDSLRFMVAEFAPELPPAQHAEFLHELKSLGHSYLAQYPADAAALHQALGAQQAGAFLDTHGRGAKIRSATLETIAAMAPENFAFVGEADVAGNYLEIMVPKPAQDLLYALRGHLLYEIIKDYATARPARTDIWVRQPVNFTDDLPQLFGSFYFGLVDMAHMAGNQITAGQQTIDLTAPILQKLLGLMRLMPFTIGDFLAHPDGAEFKTLDIIMALHTLVACGLAAPMRGSFAGIGQADTRYPRLAGLFNQAQLRAGTLAGGKAWLASVVAGRPVALPLAEALVLQAVDRVGFEESADALMGELARVAGDPALAGLVFTGGVDPAPAFAENLIRDVCGRHFVNWYALGVLDAA